ncbi:MAG: hypothetical protein KKA81_11215 [Bacteroidetes bacterium]|nr:hypothetical protein [Bacteroidota bacterium]
MNTKLNLTNAIVFFFIIISANLYAQNITHFSSPTLILKNAVIIRSQNNVSIPNRTLIIEDGLIKSILGPDSDEILPDGEIIELSGHYIIPGLIEGHNHISGITDEELQKSLKHGVMGIRDMAGDAMFLKDIQTRIDNGELLAPDIYYSVCLLAGNLSKMISGPE